MQLTKWKWIRICLAWQDVKLQGLPEGGSADLAYEAAYILIGRLEKDICRLEVPIDDAE